MRSTANRRPWARGAAAAAGDVVSRNSGAVHVRYRFDTLGDDQPGGNFVGDVDFRVAGPHADLFRSPCEIATPLIG